VPPDLRKGIPNKILEMKLKNECTTTQVWFNNNNNNNNNINLISVHLQFMINYLVITV
jgi:hypothetical protein